MCQEKNARETCGGQGLRGKLTIQEVIEGIPPSEELSEDVLRVAEHKVGEPKVLEVGLAVVALPARGKKG